MKNILHIISSPRGEASFSIKLGNAIVEQVVAANPGSVVKETNLVKKQFPHLEEAQIKSFFTPEDQYTANDTEAVRHSDEAIQELMDADIIVIGAPMYNFSIHSTLKAWIDHIMRKGKTFIYDEKGAEGLVKGKKVYVATSSGAIYSEGPMKPFDHITPYLTNLFGFMGMTDVTFFRIEGSSIPGMKEAAVEKGINSIVL